MRGIRRCVAPWALGALVALASVAGQARADDGVAAAGDAFVVSGSAGGGRSGGGGFPGGAVVIFVPVCVVAVSPVSPQPGSGCLTLSDRSCPPGESFVRRWTSGAKAWVQGDVTCLDLTGAPTVAQVSAMVRETVVHHVPEPHVTVQPAGPPLITLPVLFHSGQPDGSITWHDTVAGIPITATVSSSWTWEFGDGATLTTTDAGSRWPDTSVSHTFREPGVRTIRVTSTWTGSFRMGQLGSQEIPGTVTQTDSRSIRVTTAVSRLRATHDSRRERRR